MITHTRSAAREARLLSLRTVGLAAASAGDDAAAVAALAPYVAAHADDEEAVVRYAVARSRGNVKGDLALRDAARLLEAFTDRRSNAVEARRALLTILPRTGNAALLERLSDEALRTDADDAEAWQARATVRLWQDRRDDAVVAAMRAAELSPSDLDVRLDVLRLMDHAHRRTADLAAYAAGQFAAGDARRAILCAAAARAGNDLPAARRALAAALPSAQDPTTPAPLVMRLAEACDAAGDHTAATAVLRDGALAHPAALPLARAYAWRVWQTGQTRPLLAGWPGFDAANPVVDPELLAAHAVALFDAGHTADGAAAVRRLKARPGRVAATWAAALTARFVAPPATPARVVAAYAKCLSADPTNALVHVWTAEMYAAAGEPALALDHWTAAAAAAPAWARPHAGRAVALVALNRLDDAADAARSSYTRNPTTAAAADLIGVRFAQFTQTGDAAEAARLLSAVDAVQAACPGEPSSLAVRVAVLARTGRRAEATGVLGQALGDALARPTTPDAFARLTAVDGAECLGFTSWSPAKVTETQADRPARLAAIERSRERVGDDGLQWKLARARWLADGDDAAGWSEAVTLLSDVVRASPRELPPRLELARVLAKAGSAGTAIEHLRVARDAAPRAVEPLAALTRLLADGGRGDEALALVRQAAACETLGWSERRGLARVAADMGDADTVVRLLAVDVVPVDDRPLLAACYAATRRPDAARRLGVADPVRPAATPATAVGDWEAVARGLAAEPKRADVRPLWDGVWRSADRWAALVDLGHRTPSDVALQTLIVDTALSRHDLATAGDAALLAVAARPADARALELAVRAARAGGRWTDVRAAAERWARAAQPDFAAADTALAEALLRTGSPAAAIERARPYADRVDAAAVLAEALLATGDADAALSTLLAHAASAEGRRAAWRLVPLVATGGRAKAWLDAVPAVMADETPPRLRAVAAVARRFDDRPLAAATLAAVTAHVAGAPDDVAARVVQAGLLETLDRRAEAVRVLQDAVARRPDDAEALNDLACLLLSGDPTAARAHAVRATTASPRTATFHDTLARACVALGDETEARTQFRVALALDPQCGPARDGLRRLVRETPTASAAD